MRWFVEVWWRFGVVWVVSMDTFKFHEISSIRYLVLAEDERTTPN